MLHSIASELASRRFTPPSAVIARLALPRFRSFASNASPPTTKTKPAQKADEAMAGLVRVVLAREQARIQVGLLGRLFDAEQQKDKTVEAKALEAKLRHISHLASQAAHTTDLDDIEQKLGEMEKQLMDARAKLWKARDAEARKVEKKGKEKK